MASVIVPLAQGCEELEAITIIDILRRGDIDVITAGLDNNPVVAARGTTIIPDHTLTEVQELDVDMIALPGGLPGADNLNSSSLIHDMLQRLNNENKWLAAICAAPKVFAKAGLLENRRATSFPGSLEGYHVEGMIYSTDSIVIDGNIITSRGPGTALDFSLKLIEILVGVERRAAVEKPLQRPEYFN